MKKVSNIVFATLFATLLTACSSSDEVQSPSESEDNTEQATEETAEEESASDTSSETSNEEEGTNNAEDAEANQDDVEESTYEPQSMSQEEWEGCVESRAYTEEDCIAQDQYYAEGEGQNEASNESTTVEETQTPEEIAWQVAKDTVQEILLENNPSYSKFTYPPMEHEEVAFGYYENGDFSINSIVDAYDESKDGTYRKDFTIVITRDYAFKELVLRGNGTESGTYTPNGKIIDHNNNFINE